MPPPPLPDPGHEPLVSVVVPAFNVAAYVGECLDSILSQDEKDVEILVVDDGSTDGTGDILRKYADGDARIMAFRQENAGSSVSRNRMLDKARGEWVFFCDADDKLAPGALSRMIAAAEKDGLDALFFSASVFFDPPELESRFPAFKDRYAFSRDFSAPRTGARFFAECTESNEWKAPVWLMFLRRSLLQERSIRFLPGNIHEDVPFTLDVQLRAKAVARIPDRLYLRRIRENSIMTSRHALEDVRSYGEIAAKIIEADESGRFDDRTRAALGVLASRIIRMAGEAWYGLTEEERSRFSKERPVEHAWISVFARMRREAEAARARNAETIGRLRDSVSRRDASVESLKEAVARRDASVESLKEVVARRDASAASLKEAVARRDASVASLKASVASLKNSVASLKEAVARHNRKVSSLKEASARRDLKIEALKERVVRKNRAIQSRDDRIRRLEKALENARGNLRSIRSSTSFKIAAAISFPARLAVNVLGRIRTAGKSNGRTETRNK